MFYTVPIYIYCGTDILLRGQNDKIQLRNRTIPLHFVDSIYVSVYKSRMYSGRYFIVFVVVVAEVMCGIFTRNRMQVNGSKSVYSLMVIKVYGFSTLIFYIPL